jgi:hypothetical protein
MLFQGGFTFTNFIADAFTIYGILCSSLAAATGIALTSAPVEAMPFDTRVAGSVDGMIEKAQVVVVNPRRPPPRHLRHRQHRRWRCWWHRGRRVCGWR